MKITSQKKQVLILYGSTLFGLFLGVISSVINTRALEPSLYGDVRYVQNIIQFVSSLLLVGFFTSGSRLLALSPSEDYSRQIRGAMCAILAITMCILSLVMFVLFGFSFINNDGILTWLYLSSVFVGGNVLLLNYINTTAQGDNHIIRISAARLLPTLAYIILATVVYHFYHATPLLMLSLYNGLAVLVYLCIIYSTRPSFSNLKESFRLLNEENKKYGFDVYLGSIANVSTSYISGITLGQFCVDNTNVGFYTLALTLSTPLALLPSIIGTTYFKRFATQDKIERKVLMISFAITIASLLAFICFVGIIVDILYNEEYRSVSLYASLLAFGTSLQGLGDMFNRFLGAHGKGKYLRNGAFTCGAVIIIGSVVLVYFFQIYGAIATKILGSMTYLAMMVFYYIRFLSRIS